MVTSVQNTTRVPNSMQQLKIKKAKKSRQREMFSVGIIYDAKFVT